MGKDTYKKKPNVYKHPLISPTYEIPTRNETLMSDVQEAHGTEGHKSEVQGFK